MYTVLVVDDEALERNAIRHIINTSCPMIGEVIEAVNGIDALEKYRERMPDIVLCDIKMPGKNGLELASDIKKIRKDQCFVFLTAYDYFDYARKAIALKVDDYLLKPADSNQVVALIDTLVTRLEGQNAEARSLEEKEKRLDLLTHFFRNEYLAAILEQKTASGPLTDFHAMLTSGPSECIAAAVRIDYARFPLAIADVGQKELLHRRALTIIKNEIEMRLYSYLVHERENLIFFVLFPLSEEKSQYTSPAAIFDLFSSIGQLVQSRLSLNLVTALSCTANNPADIHAALVQVQDALGGDGHEGDIILCEPSCIEPGSPEKPGLTPRLTMLLDQVMQKIGKEYMTLLTLESVASSIQLSSFYFSKVFKQYRGMTFIDCLNEVRIQHARKLLEDPVVSIKEVAVMTGYSDANYFSRVFKNSCGVTPSEYRNKIMR